MVQHEISCGLDYIVAPDLQACLTDALQANYAFILSPIVHPRVRRSFLPTGSTLGGFTRSDMILSPQDWIRRFVGKVSGYLDPDCPSPIVRKRHEDCLNEELAYCTGLGLPAIMLSLHSRKTINLARILQTYFQNSHYNTVMWIRVPMLCHRSIRASDENNCNEEACNEPWHWWTKFHEQMGWDKRIGVVLEMSADLPSKELINRWLGEPVKAIIIPSSLFYNNKEGYPVLSEAHEQVVVSMVERDAQAIVSGARRSNVEYYLQYLDRLWKGRSYVADDPMLINTRGWEDFLQTPLQPLADNLNTHTYNVFEKDPVKYDQYQKAIAQALSELQKKRKEDIKILKDDPSIITTNINEIGQGGNCIIDDERPFIVMVLGAGRGPLVRATLNAADITNSKVKVIAVEKNPCAVVVLAAQVREVWRDRDVTVIPGDMRQINLSPKADIIVSELLGSWGDNELSPECLDGAAGLLKPGGISIPMEYTSYVAPICSPRLWAAAKTASPGNDQQTEKNLDKLWVVYMQNKHDIGETKPLFKFEHPSEGIKNHEGQEVTDCRGLQVTDNQRSATITWEVEQDNVMHGFGGYFDCRLYGKEMLSIVPNTHSPGMISWCPVFIPIRTPLRVQKGDTITATFWRRVNSRKVWYEWIVENGNHTTPLHNLNGRSSEMLF